MNEERMKILNMVAEGKLSPEEGSKLLEALGEGTAPAAASSARAGTARWLRIRVTDGGQRVNVNVPLKLLDIAKRFLPEGGIHVNGQMLDLDEIVDMVREGVEGKLVEVKGDEGEEVEIYVE